MRHQLEIDDVLQSLPNRQIHFLAPSHRDEDDLSEFGLVSVLFLFVDPAV